MKVHALLHSALGGDIHLPHWAMQRNHRWSTSLVPEAPRLPGPDEVDCLVVLGGPMSAWDDAKHPWLIREKRLLEAYLAADRPVLGICLGAQLLADVLGARVYQGERPEIGWFPVHVTTEGRSHPLGTLLPESFETFLWHGDSFDLPAGAHHLAASALFPHQAFSHGSALALQFHLEARHDWVSRLIKRDAAQLADAEFAQSVLNKPEALFQENNLLLERLLDRWLPSLNLS